MTASFTSTSPSLQNDQHSSSSSSNGQVTIHPKKTAASSPSATEQQPPKTPADLEKERWQEAHRIACEGNHKFYTDPKTGYSVMTELLHRDREYCCGNACRHCPYEYQNVNVSPEVKRANIERGKQARKERVAREGKRIWAEDTQQSDSD
ncbi:hypothetical protein DFQ26_000345 [Actinomortierella ambigua]|nr:hypothetical protein DFQ26_000345 [Actinomortierella ambigua]